jgi:hypothetical protein
MAETRFTPGPWFREAIGIRGKSRLVTICYGRNHYGDGPAGTVCHIEGATKEDECLMIAAREMYAALIKARDALYSNGAVHGDATLDAIDAALAKARGED